MSLRKWIDISQHLMPFRADFEKNSEQNKEQEEQVEPKKKLLIDS